MANSIGDVKITLRAEDRVTPVLRRIRRDMWLLRHGRLALALLALGWLFAGLLLGVALGLAVPR